MRAALLVILVGCASSTPPPVPIDTTDDVPAADVCDHLAALDCEEGRRSNCVATIEKVRRYRLTRVNSRCLRDAVSKEAARTCEFVRCP